MALSVPKSLSKLRTPIMITAAVGAVAALTLGVTTADAATPQVHHTLTGGSGSASTPLPSVGAVHVLPGGTPASGGIGVVAVPGAVPQHVVWGGTPVDLGPIDPSTVGKGTTAPGPVTAPAAGK